MLIALTFGPSRDSSIYWNQKQLFSDETTAVEYARDEMKTPGVFGYVILECDLSSYSVIDELGLGPRAEVSQSNGQIRVQPPGYVSK